MAKWFENESVRKEEWRPGGEELDYGYGMYGKWTSACVNLGPYHYWHIDRGLNSTNHMPEVGGNRNR